jgi:1-acyl-sn-glycerol-3-phosphate acyltransferase
VRAKWTPTERELLSPLERAQLALIRQTFDARSVGRTIQWLQHHLGQHWILLSTDRLHRVHHINRVPPLSPDQSFIVVCNHRSFFDLYVVVSNLIRAGFHQRIFFPVRSTFFYDNPLGFVVNGVMSFFAMYPPIFRDRKKAVLNAAAMDEVVRLLRQGGTMLGYHPEGTRNKGDPYKLLPVRAGIGRLVHGARVPVVPVFTNGLRVDGLATQVKSNFDGTGIPIHTVFGAPIDFGTLLDQPANQSTFKQIANRIASTISELGQEEKQLRAEAGDPAVTG